MGLRLGRLESIATHPTPGASMVEREGGELRPGVGVVGDVPGRGRKREVTVVDRGAWERACEALGTEVPWTSRRANLLVSGVALRDTEGHELRIGAVRLLITGETQPCRLMDRRHPGLRKVLAPEWRGGVTCTVIAGGRLTAGAPVELTTGLLSLPTSWVDRKEAPTSTRSIPQDDSR